MQDWKTREVERFASGYYQLVPWTKEDWWTPIEGHYAHVSHEDPSKLAYTPDERHGREDRQLRTKPGRYLAKFFPALAPTAVQQAVDMWNGAHDAGSVLFASSPDDIERVYREGPSSCMDGGHRFRSPVHPARVYGAGDLAVAYLERGGRITARAVCWPERKSYSTVYGDSARLESALGALGYRDDGAFDGARLLRIEAYGRFVCPYIDAEYDVVDSGDFLRLAGEGNGSRPTETDGLLTIGEPCEYCGRGTGGDGIDVSGSYWCEDCANAHASRCARCEDWCEDENTFCVDSETWCEDCASNYSFTCERCGESTGGDAVDVAGETWCEYCADTYAWTCEHCGERFPDGRGNTRAVDVDGETWCEDCATNDAIMCARCGELTAYATARQLSDGEHVCPDCAGECITCARCGELAREPDTRTPEGEGPFCATCEDWHQKRAEALSGRQLLLSIAPGATLLPACASAGASSLLLPAHAGRRIADIRPGHPIALPAGRFLPRSSWGCSCDSCMYFVNRGIAPMSARRAHAIRRLLASASLPVRPGFYFVTEEGICSCFA